MLYVVCNAATLWCTVCYRLFHLTKVMVTCWVNFVQHCVINIPLACCGYTGAGGHGCESCLLPIFVSRVSSRSVAVYVLVLCVCVCVLLSFRLLVCNNFFWTEYLQKLWTDFRKIFWRGGLRNLVTFRWCSGFFRGPGSFSRILCHWQIGCKVTFCNVCQQVMNGFHFLFILSQS